MTELQMWLGILICFIVYVIYCFLYGTPLKKSKSKIHNYSNKYPPFHIRKNLPELIADKYVIEISKSEFNYNRFETLELKRLITITNMLYRQETLDSYLTINNRDYIILHLNDSDLKSSIFSLLDIETDEKYYLEITTSNLNKFEFKIIN